jgi:hypothetical protein
LCLVNLPKRTLTDLKYHSEKVMNIQNRAGYELAGCLFDIHPTKTRDFLDKFLPRHKDVETEKVLAALVGAGHYDAQRKCWPHLTLDRKRTAEGNVYREFELRSLRKPQILPTTPLTAPKPLLPFPRLSLCSPI